MCFFHYLGVLVQHLLHHQNRILVQKEHLKKYKIMINLCKYSFYNLRKLNFFLYSVIQDPSTQRLHWTSSPNNILIIRKPGPQTMPEFRQLILQLLKVNKYSNEIVFFSIFYFSDALMFISSSLNICIYLLLMMLN